MMNAARLYGVRDIHIEAIPAPTAGPGEVLVRVRAVAICASDCHLYTGGHSGGVVPDHPMIQGHEFAGDIVALGEGVSQPPIGTRVAVEPSWHCGECDVCRRGLHNLCRNIIFPSFPNRDGALAEYIACPAHAVCPLPDQCTYIDGALTEPLGVAIHAVRLATQARCGGASLSSDTTILVQGAGMIGCCTLLVLRDQGFRRITVVEPNEGRRELAQRLGAEATAACAEELLSAGYDAEVVFECSGDNTAAADSLALAEPAATVIIIGIPQPEQVLIDFAIPRRKQLQVIFSRRSLNTLPEAVSLVASGRIALNTLPVREYALADTAAAIEATIARPADMVRAVVIP